MATEWGYPIASFSSGNWNRFVDADPLPDGEGGVDFGNTFSSENPFIFTNQNPLSFLSALREDP